MTLKTLSDTHPSRADASEPLQAIGLTLALCAQAKNTWQRRLLLLEGEAEQTLTTAQSIVQALHQEWAFSHPVEWIGRGPTGQAQPARQTNRLLGRERDLIFYDLFSGLDVDALAAAAGTLRGGGLLILLGPPLHQWPSFTDPVAERIATYPYRGADVGHGFLTRMARLLAEAPGTPQAIVTAGHTKLSPQAHSGTQQISEPPALITSLANSVLDSDWTLTAEQQQALVLIRRLMADAKPRPLVVTAGRGRGKSTALGLAAAELCRDQARSILITAPRFEAARTLLEQARQTVLESQVGSCTPKPATEPVTKPTPKSKSEPEECLRFLPPDQLARERPATDLLLVDEAAGIPAPLLRALLEHYPRIVFATTVQGYEGTGRGFALRFFPLLDQLKPGWRHLELHQPVRFAADDPLEALINRVLLLDAEPATEAQVIASAGSPVRIEVCDRLRLAQQEERLHQLFGLLMLAHYQTRPSDLRDLLDGPNLSLMTLNRSQTLLATALIAREGAIDDALSAAIFAGERRPRGHLLPQTLSAHAGLASAPPLSYARIVRIAVHPSAQHQGLGRTLLEAVIAQASQDGCDLIGASFGANAVLLPFWHACGFIPVQLGSRRNATTGAHSAVVLRALSQAGQALLTEARVCFLERLLPLLPGRLRALEPALVLELLRAPLADQPPAGRADPELIRRPIQGFAQQPAQQPVQISAELHAFAHQQRSLEAALPVLARLAPESLASALAQRAIRQDHAECFVAVVLQQYSPEEIAPRCGYSGRAALIRQLRQTTAVLLSRQ